MGLLGVLDNGHSVSVNALVGGLDLGSGGLSQGSEGALLGEHGNSKVVLGKFLVLAHDLASVSRTLKVLLVTLVLELGSGSEVTLDNAHVAIEDILGDLSVDSHLVQEHLLHLGGAASLSSMFFAIWERMESMSFLRAAVSGAMDP